MSTRSEPFSLLICLDATKFVLPSVFTLIVTICPINCSKSYHASRGFSLAWLLALTKSFAWLVVTNYANDLVNAKSHAREETLLAGY